MVVRNLDDFRQVAIGGFGFVSIAAQQRVLHAADVPGRRAAHDEGVEAVEGADVAERHIAAFRRVGIDVGKILEIRRQRERAQQREPVGARLRLGDGAGGQQRTQQKEETSPPVACFASHCV